MAPKVGSSGAGSQASGSGWAPLRKDAPGRLVRTRGKFPLLDTPEARAAAIEEVRSGVYAASSQAGVKSRRTFLRRALAQWEQEPFPPSVEKIERVAAVLKQGGYRSASSYLGQYRADSERDGHEVTDPMRRAFTYMTTSCERGQGPWGAYHEHPYGPAG